MVQRMIRNKALYIFLLLALSTCGCRNWESRSLKDSSASIRFLALGDSYTIGESVEEEERWPVQLADRIEAQGCGSVDLEIIARTGWTTGDLLQALDRQVPQGPYELVSLQIGVNNQFQGRSQEQYSEEFRLLLERAVKLADGDPGRVVVLSIPDWGVTPFADRRDTGRIQTEIDAFNLINKTESLKLGVNYVDITDISREAEGDLSLLSADELHPSGEMYGRWVNRIWPEIFRMLNTD